MVNHRLQLTRLTASGRGAVAVVRIDTIDPTEAGAIDSCFAAANGMQPSDAPVGRILYGLWGAEDVVIVRTQPQQLEINCHGGEAAVKQITADLQAASHNTTQRSDRDDIPSQPLAIRLQSALERELLKCRSLRTAEYLLAQQQGVLSDFVHKLGGLQSSQQRNVLVDRFLSWQTFARHLTQPWRVAIIGQPNAGKSSLLNAIVGFERSIVFDQPGTTRDRVEAEIMLDGWPFRLIDTAGIREQSADTIEAIGVDVALASLNDCDACLLVIDSTVGWTDVDAGLLNRIPGTVPIAILQNKADLPPPTTEATSTLQRSNITTIRTSVKTSAGLPELLAWLPETLVPTPPDINEPLPVIPELLSEITATEFS